MTEQPEQPPTFVGPDGAEYQYADPTVAPPMDEVDSTSIEDPVDAPDEPVEPAGESTPPEE